MSLKNYEMFLILTPKKDDAAAQKSIREVEAVLGKYGAKITKTNSGSNNRLAVPIGKRVESFQLTLEVEAEPSSIAELNKQLRLVDDVLRHEFFTLAA